jgi:hypothetical protein
MGEGTLEREIVYPPMQCCGGVRSAQEIHYLDEDREPSVLVVEQHALWCAKAIRLMR